MQQQHEVALAVSEAQQLRHAEQMHEVEAQLVLAQNHAAGIEQQSQQIQHSLMSLDCNRGCTYAAYIEHD